MSDPIRECGSCTACCTVMGVPEIGKGTYQACEHLCDTGCGIYADRPGSCRTFECQWLRGVLEVDGAVDLGLRPDSCGVIFDYQPETMFGELYQAWEVEPGASDGGKPKDIIEELGERFLVVVMAHGPHGTRQPDERRLVGPMHLVSRAGDLMGRGPT